MPRSCSQKPIGASGAMEADMGAEVVNRLNSDDDAGVWVEELVTDLDAKVHAAVKAACEASGEAPPAQRSDANHAMKAAKKKLFDRSPCVCWRRLPKRPT